MLIMLIHSLISNHMSYNMARAREGRVSSQRERQTQNQYQAACNQRTDHVRLQHIPIVLGCDCVGMSAGKVATSCQW